nr:putative glycosyltransferase [Anoectochilus roxburghii]
MSCEDDDGVSGGDCPPHFLIVPFMEQGHMIPMLDLARLLASRGVLVTFVSTPVNLARIRPIAERATAAALPIRFIELSFPSVAAGLPDGCENLDQISSPDLFLPFVNALPLLQEPLLAHLRSSESAGWPMPTGIVSDNILPWAADLARSLDIPRIIFHGPSCFYLLCYNLIQQNKADLEAAIEAASGGPITIPGLPQPIWISKHQVVNTRYTGPGWSKFRESVLEAGESADGVVLNSFAELEPWYLKTYREAINKPVWPIGPLSLYKEDSVVKAARGQASSVDNLQLFQWLDKQEAGSVVFVSFGSIAMNTAAQMMELGHGLEASGRPFVWVVKEVAEGREAPVLEEWLAGLDKRLDGRGVLIRGWAPQAMILEHAAIGGFLTHCGWNSTLESVAAGVVMATWPHFADQFLNERLVVDVLGIGVAVGVKEPTIIGVEETVVKVNRGEVERAVERLMGEGEEAEERRGRARELGEKARCAMEEGGSSWVGLQEVINYMSHQSMEKKKKN